MIFKIKKCIFGELINELITHFITKNTIKTTQ